MKVRIRIISLMLLNEDTMKKFVYPFINDLHLLLNPTEQQVTCCAYRLCGCFTNERLLHYDGHTYAILYTRSSCKRNFLKKGLQYVSLNIHFRSSLPRLAWRTVSHLLWWGVRGPAESLHQHSVPKAPKSFTGHSVRRIEEHVQYCGCEVDLDSTSFQSGVASRTAWGC